MGRYSTPIAALISRLKFHSTNGQTPARRLAGFKIVEAPTKETEGENDLPNIRIAIPDFADHFAGGRNIDGKMEIKILIGSARKHGIAKLYENIEKVLDALETDENGYVSVIPGLARPTDCRVQEAKPGDTTLTAPLSIFIVPRKTELGKRFPLSAPPAPPTTNIIQGVGDEDILGVGGEYIGGV